MSSPESPPACRQCGACCRWSGHVLVDAGDIRRLSRGLAISEEDFIRRFAVLARNRRGLSLADQDGGACVFLDGNRCRVYAHRPAQCRDFPAKWQVPGCPCGAAPAP